MEGSPEEKPRRSRRAVMIVGGILLGAIGSGLWERVIGPGITAVYRWCLQSGTLVGQRYLDVVYAEIGERGTSAIEYMALHLGEFLTMLALLVLGTSLFFALVFLEGSGKVQTRGAYRLARFISSWPDRLLPWAAWFDIIMIAIVGIVLTIEIERCSYQSQAAQHLQRCVTLVRPHVSQAVWEHLCAAEVGIDSRQDYVQLRRELELRADTAKVALPRFRAW